MYLLTPYLVLALYLHDFPRGEDGKYRMLIRLPTCMVWGAGGAQCPKRQSGKRLVSKGRGAHSSNVRPPKTKTALHVSHHQTVRHTYAQ